jgi:glycosyltransferase involved in cell wall biosynthesis
MKVLHVTPSFYPAVFYGGPTYSTYSLCQSLAKCDVDISVLTTNANGPDAVLDVETDQEITLGDRLSVLYCRRLIHQSISLQLLYRLRSSVQWADMIHLTAVYNFPTIPTLLLCSLLDKPVIWSPRGGLQRWEGSTHLMAKAAWELVCLFVAPKKLILHVTSDQEAEESLKRIPGIKVAVIPNGIEIPIKVSHVPRNGMVRLLYLGRLDPKKGIENLFSACNLLNKNASPAWYLTIAGAGEREFTEILRVRMEKLGLSKQVKMVGQVSGDAKRHLFENTDIVVVPSYTENFGLVVAEALAHGVPVVASKGTPWHRVEEIGCGLWVNNDPDSLTKAIEQICRMPLREMGEQGRDWMKKEFTWELRAQEMIAVYEECLSKNRLI